MSRAVTVVRSPAFMVMAGATAARGGVLLLLAVGALVLSHGRLSVLVYLLAVTTAGQVLVDPGGANYLVATQERTPGRVAARWWAGLRLQAVAAAVVAVIAFATAVAVFHQHRSWLLGSSLGILAGAEGIARYARTTWQIEQQFRRYAAIDFAVAIGRVLTTVALAISGNEWWLAVSSLVVATNLVFWSIVLAHPDSYGQQVSMLAFLRGTWPYGLSTSFAAFYSQGPAVLLGLVAGVRVAAAYSIAARITQPTELIPSAIASVYLPRLVGQLQHHRRTVFLHQARLAFWIGAVCAASITVLSPLLPRLFGFHFSEVGIVLIVLALILPVKFVNYQLVALAIANGKIHSRLRASAVVAVISIAGVCVLARYGAGAVAVSAAICEVLLLLMLAAGAQLRRIEAIPVTETA